MKQPKPIKIKEEGYYNYNPYGSMWIPFAFLFLMMGGLIVFALWSMSGVECDYHSTSKLILVNGIKDVDTGFFAGGTVREKNLLFENGLIANLEDTGMNIELMIGKEYRIEKCINNGKKLWYEVSPSKINVEAKD